MRHLARVVSIDDVIKHPNADALDLCIVGGWQVVSKVGEFKKDDKAVYFEIDSWIPTELAPFLSKGKEPRVFNQVKGEKLKTVRLRGEISQGLILPISILPEGTYEADQDVTELLGVQKWELPLNAQLAGSCRSTFPSYVPKTDQERLQNCKKHFDKWKSSGDLFEVTEKLEGSSMTVIIKDDDFHVCSRNMDLLDTPENTFWKVAKQYDIESKIRTLGRDIAIQGELIGEGVQGNIYKLKGNRFYVYDMYDIKAAKYLSSAERTELTAKLGLLHVPILYTGFTLREEDTIQSLLEGADGKSELYDTLREGLVFKQVNGLYSFKTVSNQYLLQ